MEVYSTLFKENVRLTFFNVTIINYYKIAYFLMIFR
jgi:hypothetical protein